MKRQTRALLTSVLLVFGVGISGQSVPAAHWVGTWATSPVGRLGTPPPAPVPSTPPVPGAAGRGNAPAPFVPNNQTLREIVHTSLGGDALRIVVANSFGTAPLQVGAASVALHESGSAIVTATSHAVTFGGKPTATVPAGAVMMSDPVTMTLPAFSDLAVDLFLPQDMSTMPVTLHAAAHQTSYASAGNHAGEHDLTASTTTSWYYLSRVEVRTTARTAAVVALGDSITDGTGSTLDANSRWPDLLARRLAAQGGGGVTTAVLNAGIGGNQLLGQGNPNAGTNVLARFDRDVLALAGATHVVVMEGINDIGLARENVTPGAADLIAAQQQIIERAHAHGLKVIGATLTPFEGATYFTAAGEAKRAAVNTWIRTGKAYDGVIDFDAAVRDPQAPTKFQAQYESGDHLHPSDAGYQAMSRAIDLALFQ